MQSGQQTPEACTAVAKATNMTDAELRLRAQLSAHTSWANTKNQTARTQPGRDAMRRKFEQQVDPNGVLSPAERAKRAENLRKAHMTRLALRA